MTLVVVALLLRVFHPVALADFATCGLTHVSVTGRAEAPRRERDRDVVFDLRDGTVTVHVEIIPEVPLRRPKAGSCVTVWGIRRFDDTKTPGHQRWEVHPALGWTLARCA